MYAYIRVIKIIFIFIVSIFFSFQYVKAQDSSIDLRSFAILRTDAVLPPQDYFITSKGDHYLFLVEDFHLRHVLGQVMHGKYEYALDNIFFVLRAFPNHPKALFFLGRIAKMIKQPSLPISFYNKALSGSNYKGKWYSFHQNAYTHAQFGNYLAEISEDGIDSIKEGILELKRAIEINPKLAKAHTWLAKAYYKDGNSALALQAARKAKELGSQDTMLDEIQKNILQKKDK